MPVSRMEAPANLEAITNEDDFQTLVVDALRRMGWVVIHIKEMFGNPKGVPDLLCFTVGDYLQAGDWGDDRLTEVTVGRGQMIELKIIGNTVRAGQKRWRERWLPEGVTVLDVWNRSADWERMMDVMER
jgi:hypothetical protein